ncbi:hypothetical protein V6N13_080302 [Hibiscus sabdariffa]
MPASRTGECSAGRSLASDAAFFTSPVQKSIESDSTLGSDYSLSSLEIDLFGDIHAKVNQSIQFVEFQLPTSKSNRHSKSPLLNPLQPPEDQKLLQMEWGRQQKKPPILLKHRDHGPYETSSNDTWRMGASIREFLDLMLSWDERVKVLKDVASAVCYLYQGWEAKVLHRDIKASNVILDKDMNARLGRFRIISRENRLAIHEWLAWSDTWCRN